MKNNILGISLMSIALAMPVVTASAHGTVEEKFISYDADKDEMKTYDSQEAMYRALGIKPRPTNKPRFGRRHVRHWMEVDEEKDAYPVLSPDGKMEAYRQCWHLWLLGWRTGEYYSRIAAWRLL